MDARKNNPAGNTADREIVITRIVAAPRELVWDAWTDPKQVSQWWGPNGFTTTIEKMDVRPGGVWKHVMHGPDGTDYPNYSVFKEVVKPERIVFSHGGSGEDSPESLADATWTFEALGDKTRVTIRMVFPSKAARDRVVKEHNAIEGGKQTLARLSGYLPKIAATVSDATSNTQFIAPPGIAELRITRLFDAPIGLVFKTWIDPKLVPEWWGPAYLSTTVERMEPKSGGGYRIFQRAPDGKVHGFRGVYHTVEAPHLIISTFEYDGYPHHVSLDTYRFEARGNQTFHTNVSVFQSLADRDGMVAANCEPGVRETMDRMEQLLKRLKETA